MCPVQVCVDDDFSFQVLYIHGRGSDWAEVLRMLRSPGAGCVDPNDIRVVLMARLPGSALHVGTPSESGGI